LSHKDGQYLRPH